MTVKASIVGGGSILWEDCFLDAIKACRDGYIFEGAFHLLSSHPDYTFPLPGEWGCYRDGELLLESVSNSKWEYHDANGWKVSHWELPYRWADEQGPSIDHLVFEDHEFELEAGNLRFAAWVRQVRLILKPATE